MPTADVNAATTVPDKESAVSNLAQRVVTGSGLAALVAAATLLLPSFWFAVLIAAFVLVGAWEWSGMAGWPSAGQRLVYCVASMLVLLGAGWLLQSQGGTWAVLLAGLTWWLVALVWVVRFQQGQTVDAMNHPLVRLLVGWLILVPSWAAVAHLHSALASGPWMVLYLVFLISVADSAAFFVGRRLGSRRLASNVSPGKSLEGVAGALVATTIFAIAAGLAFGSVPLLGFVVVSLLTALVSILGDLSESVFKRRAGLKDSGSIVPGHGGILDRIDSYTAAAPIFVLGYFWQNSAL
jgi:phosphatidate cytidylyltransferase